MIAKVQSYALSGLEGVCVTVEADISKGLPSYEMVGLPDTAVKESKERVRSAIKNSMLEFPAHKITVNFAPAPCTNTAYSGKKGAKTINSSPSQASA